jgi:CDGSH-type Zn-finger protein/uncharacterized Fe-S cluster protein YjdI
MSKKKIYEFEGADVIVRWDRARCIHAEKCVHGSPEAFDPNRRPWIEPDHVDADEVARVVWDCPTGALHYERTDGGDAEPIPSSNVARLVVDGPVYVEGKIVFKFPNGALGSENRVALCRCGDSKNKPYCDNSHIEAGFTDDGSLGTAMLAPGEGDDPGARLELSSAPNGPLLVKGPIEIQSADGTDAQSGVKGALCRCGASRNRPYCDGSHAAAGFEAE